MFALSGDFRMKRIALAAVLLVSLVGLARAGLDEADRAYVRGDYATALKEYRALAEQGDVDAQFMLGSMYDKGYGVPQDHTEAVKWYRKAAEQGDAQAQFSLGIMYFNGKGVPQDYVQAHMWFNLAAAQDDGIGRKNRDIAAQIMTPADISKARALAREWLETHQ